MNEVFKALSNPTRREILRLLRERPMTASELADHFDLAKPTMSGHFAILKAADLVYNRRSGTTLTFYLNVSVLEEVIWVFADKLQLGKPPRKKS